MSEKQCPKVNYGGQAVVEGVMMRGKKYFSVVCKKQNGEIVSTCENVENNLGSFNKFLKYSYKLVSFISFKSSIYPYFDALPIFSSSFAISFIGLMM